MGMPIPDTLAGRTACIQLRRRVFRQKNEGIGNRILCRSRQDRGIIRSLATEFHENFRLSQTQKRKHPRKAVISLYLLVIAGSVLARRITLLMAKTRSVRSSANCLARTNSSAAISF